MDNPLFSNICCFLLVMNILIVLLFVLYFPVYLHMLTSAETHTYCSVLTSSLAQAESPWRL